MTTAEERAARAWLVGNGLPDAPVSELLVARLAARRRARLADHVVLAAVIIVAAGAHAANFSAPARSSPDRPVLLMVLGAAAAGLLVSRLLIARWLAAADRRAGAALPRRAAHAVKPGWRVVLGLPHAVFGLATLGVAVVLALGAMTVEEPTVWQGGVILLVAVLGVGVGSAVQLRQLLTRPVVAEDEVSLTADVIMRVEDAREATAPAVLWSLPVVLPFGLAPAWWNAAAVAAVVLGVAALVLLHARTPGSLATARQAMIVQ
ncbi:hypothetical protein ACQEVZ_04920 [Dactylosporangium sp. CA-152071]|uniref:hypothetical protein n=1 Tax=Dactylosporangium sp. CA-152071 TaxID=3239933 RepID=UPI003D8F1DD0